jgi:hypothetical protein
MGGVGSGGNNRLSDEERVKRGTFRADRTDVERDAAAASKVVTGIFLQTIPPPELPLNEIGTTKYNDLARILFEANKLTTVTRMLVEQAASLHQEMHRRLTLKKPVPASLSTQMQRALGQLKIAEDAPAIANPAGKVNKFEGCGFSSRLSSTRALR